MIFVDSGPLIARALVRDAYHDVAKRGWHLMKGLPIQLVTSNLVLSEVFTFIARRSSYTFAAERARAILDSRAFEVLRPEADDDLAALAFFEKYADQRVSFTDCTSFALMRRRRITKAFSFDRHFALAGFEVWSPEASILNEPPLPVWPPPSPAHGDGGA